MPKIIKFGGDLTKFWQKKLVHFLAHPVISSNVLDVLVEWEVDNLPQCIVGTHVNAERWMSVIIEFCYASECAYNKVTCL